jgi:hypothetical protein
MPQILNPNPGYFRPNPALRFRFLLDPSMALKAMALSRHDRDETKTTIYFHNPPEPNFLHSVRFHQVNKRCYQLQLNGFFVELLRTHPFQGALRPFLVHCPLIPIVR